MMFWVDYFGAEIIVQESLFRQRNGIKSDKSISKITYISRFYTYVTVVFRSFRRSGILDR